MVGQVRFFFLQQTYLHFNSIELLSVIQSCMLLITVLSLKGTGMTGVMETGEVCECTATDACFAA